MKVKIVLLALAVVSLTYCKSKKESTETTKTTTTVKPAETNSDAALLSSAKTLYPGIADADVLEGQTLYRGKCGKCHGLPELASIKEEKWPGVMDWMAPKAKMDDVQKQKTLKYVLSARAIGYKN